MATKSVKWVLIENIIGICVFLVGLLAANFLIPQIGNDHYSGIVGFFNANIVFWLEIAIVGLLSDLFFCFAFPFSLLAPLLSAVFGVMVISFMAKLFAFLDSLFSWNVFYVFWPYILIAFIVVFILAIIVGYFKVFSGFLHRVQKPSKAKKLPKKGHTWDDVNSEFREAMYTAGEIINDALKKAKKKLKSSSR